MGNQKKASSSSATTTSESESSKSSERSQLLKTSQRLLKGDLSDEEIAYWRDYLKQFSIAELRYAFERWNDNSDWFPKPHHIRELCEAYRLGESEKLLPIGCPRCDWTGYYQVRQSGVERVVAGCPCRANPSLRTRNYRKPATEGEVEAMWHELQQKIALARPQLEAQAPAPRKPSQPSPKQSTGVPTAKELAEQLHQRGHMKFVGKEA